LLRNVDSYIPRCHISAYQNIVTEKNCHFYLLEVAGSTIHPGGSSLNVTTYVFLPHHTAIGPTAHRVGILT